MHPRLTGEVAALTAALLWAVATILFRRIGRRVPSAELNLLKGLVAMALLAAALSVRGSLGAPLPARATGGLLVSGAIGIGIGDTAYFESLRCLGSRLALLLGMLAPPLAGLTAFALLGETLAAPAWLGVGLVVGGVAWVVSEKTPESDGTKRALGRGIACGVLASLMQALGAVLSRAALVSSDIDVFWSALLRLAAGAVITLFWLAARRRRPGLWLRAPDAGRIWTTLLAAAGLGTFLGLALQQFALRLTSAGIAQTLLATSPIFVLPLAALARERVSGRAVLGAFVALAGVAMLFGLASW